MANGDMETSFKIDAVGPYRPPQKLRFRGVITMAKSVAIAVRVTERAAFPLDICVKKLETFPPGQAATINMPKAMLGMGSVSHTSKKVTNGSSIN